MLWSVSPTTQTLRRAAAEQDHELVLGDVGVLVLIDEDLLEAVLVVLEHVGTLPEHAHGPDEEVVEVHRVRGHEAPLVLAIGLGDAALVDGPGPRFEGGGVDQVRLGRADDAEHGPGREALLVDAEVVEDMLDEPAAVAVVVDRETMPVADPVRVAAQHANTGGVEGRHPHPGGVGTDELDDAPSHLVGRLVREGDGEYPPRLHARDDEAGDAPGQDPGLARPGPGDHDERAALVQHRLALGRVQVRDEVCDRAGDRRRLLGGIGLLVLGPEARAHDAAPGSERGEVAEKVPLVVSPWAGSSRGQRRHRSRHYRRAGAAPKGEGGKAGGITPIRSCPGAWT